MKDSLPGLNFPDFSFSLKQEGSKELIFDVIRKKWLVLTPEEWVRQHLVHFLIFERLVPPGLISLEKAITVNRMTKRFDLLVFSHQAKPLLLAECKAPGVSLSQNVLDQVGRYNIAFHVPLLLVTNGLNHYCCRVDFVSNTYGILPDLPYFSEWEQSAF